jgi:hypothetical protein
VTFPCISRSPRIPLSLVDILYSISNALDLIKPYNLLEVVYLMSGKRWIKKKNRMRIEEGEELYA